MSASRIAPKLYQGSLPPNGDVLRAQGIHTVVLCAEELQPDDWQFGTEIEVLRCPFGDVLGAELPFETQMMVHRTASAVASRVRQQKRVLVTCAMGLNRSGLVTALALTELYGMSGRDAVGQVRRERQGALFNEQFVAIIERVPARTAGHPGLS